MAADTPAPKLAPELTHFRGGLPRMVDVTDKAPTTRSATAEAWVRLPPEARAALEAGTNPKGDPLSVARLAGLAGSKRTADLILLCHPIPVTGADVQVTLEDAGVRITATVRTTAPTGVEMEALTAASVAALTIYDMCKAVDRGMTIESIRLLEKLGGKSGHFKADQQ